MKIVFLALLLTNLGVYAYRSWIAPDPAAKPAPSPSIDGPQLALAGEAIGGAAAVAAPITGGGTAAALGSDDLLTDFHRCISIGPFSELPDAVQAQAALRESGYEPRQRAAQGQIWAGYWVHLPPAGTRESAEGALQSLRGGGITDSYIVPSGEQRNVVSLGVFSDLDRARRRAQEIRRIGFMPEVSERHRAGTVYWVDIELGDRSMIDPARFQSQPGRILRLTVEACPPAE